MFTTSLLLAASSVWVGACVNWRPSASWSVSWHWNWKQSKRVHEFWSSCSWWNCDCCMSVLSYFLVSSHSLLSLLRLQQFSNPNLLLKMVKARLSREDAKLNGWILDGYPRSFAQAQSLEEMKIRPDVYIMLDVCRCSVSTLLGQRFSEILNYVSRSF